jgi:hypothetical protein
VIEGMNGQYSCEKCNKVFDEVSYSSKCVSICAFSLDGYLF